MPAYRISAGVLARQWVTPGASVSFVGAAEEIRGGFRSPDWPGLRDGRLIPLLDTSARRTGAQVVPVSGAGSVSSLSAAATLTITTASGSLSAASGRGTLS